MSASPIVPVLAEGAQTPVSVVLDVPSGDAITSWRIAVMFDPNVVSFVGCPPYVYSCVYAGPSPVVNTVIVAGQTGSNGVTGSFTAATLTFQGKGTGTTPVEVAVLAATSTGAPLEFAVGSSGAGGTPLVLGFPGPTTVEPIGAIGVLPDVTGLSTTQGPVGGGTSVLVEGAGFSGPTLDVTDAVYGTLDGSLGSGITGVLFGGVPGAIPNGGPLTSTELQALSPPASSTMATVPTGGDCAGGAGCTVDVQLVANLGGTSAGSLVGDVFIGGQRSVKVTGDRFAYTPGSSPGIELTPVAQTADPGATVTVKVQAVPPAGGLSSWDVLLQVKAPVYNAICNTKSSVDDAGNTVGLSQFCTVNGGLGTVELQGNASSGALTGTSPITLATITATAGSAVTQGTVGTITPSLISFNGPPTNASATGAMITVASVPVIDGITSGCASGQSNPYPDAGWPGGGLTELPTHGGSAVCIHGSGFNTASGGLTVTFGGQKAQIVTVTANTVTVLPPADGTFGDVTGDGQVTAGDALCILRAVVGLAATGGCPAGGLGTPGLQTIVPITVTDNDTATLTPGTSTYSGTGQTVTYTYDNFDVSGRGAAPNALDAQCVLFIAGGFPPGNAIYPSACPKPPIETT